MRVHLVPDLPDDALATVLGSYLTGHLRQTIAEQAPPAAVHAVPVFARRFAVSLMCEHENDAQAGVDIGIDDRAVARIGSLYVAVAITPPVGREEAQDSETRCN